MPRLLWVVALAALSSPLLANWPEPPYVIMISIDGLRPSAYTTPDLVRMPVLKGLAASGASARGVVGVFPTVTYPSHTTLITGVPPAVHGIVDNRILDPEGRSDGAWYWYARAIQVPTLPGVLRARGLRVGAVSWPVTVGMDLDFLVPEYWRSDHPESLNLLRALSHPAWLLDDVAAAREGGLAWPFTDAERTALGAWIFRVHKPHLLLLHIFESDTAAHTYGPDSPEATAALERADGHIAAMIDAARAAGIAGRTNVVIVSDHGFVPLHDQLQPNALFREEGLVTVENGRVTGWDAWFHASGGSGVVYLRDRSNSALAERVSRVLARLASDPANGVERVWTAEDLRRAGANPEASFALSMQPGYYSASGHDTLRKAPPSKGGHGFSPELPALHASLVMAGPDVAKLGDLGIVRMTQIAPTIASWFGVSLSPEADSPLPGLTRPPHPAPLPRSGEREWAREVTPVR